MPTTVSRSSMSYRNNLQIKEISGYVYDCLIPMYFNGHLGRFSQYVCEISRRSSDFNIHSCFRLYINIWEYDIPSVAETCPILTPNCIKVMIQWQPASQSTCNMKLVLFAVSAFMPVISARLPYIVGGNDVSVPGKWPWQVSLQQFYMHECGGAILSPDWILTAAHCVGSSPSMYSVVVGMHDRSMYMGEPRRYYVDRIITHEGWTGSENGLPNDIALMKLSDSAD